MKKFIYYTLAGISAISALLFSVLLVLAIIFCNEVMFVSAIFTGYVFLLTGLIIGNTEEP